MTHAKFQLNPRTSTKISKKTSRLTPWRFFGLRKKSFESFRNLAWVIFDPILLLRIFFLAQSEHIWAQNGQIPVKRGFLKAGNGYLKAGNITSMLNFVTYYYPNKKTIENSILNFGHNGWKFPTSWNGIFRKDLEF